MFALAIHYLNGWVMAAADGAQKKRAEWPIHPDRVFMALAAAYFETDEGDKSDERMALEWLEEQPPPLIAASEAEPRKVVTCFVPVNDTADPFEKGDKLAQVSGSLPIGRRRRERAFPVAVPHRPISHLIWPDAIPSDVQQKSLVALCRKVTNVGHSASFVQMWLDDSPPDPNWLPCNGLATHRLRVPGKGRLAYFEDRCQRDRVIRYADLSHDIEDLKKHTKAIRGRSPKKKALEAERVRLEQILQAEYPNGAPVSMRPEPGLWQGYGPPIIETATPVHGSVFDPNLVVLTLSGHRLSLRGTLKLMEALRNAVMALCPQPLPEWLTGHTPEGRASAAPHLAFLPLPFVGHEHADGRLMGVAFALPQNLNPSEASRCLGAMLRNEHGLSRPIRLFNGKWFDCTAELETRETPPWNLRAEKWNGPALRWASVTPVVLDRHFDGKEKWEQAAETVKTACERIGLPRPLAVLLDPVSKFKGVPRSNEFPPLLRKSDGGRMHHAHAEIVFGEKVFGPVLIGAGRFRGYGLLRPCHQGGGDDV